MAGRRAQKGTEEERYWATRLQSADFKRGLTNVLRHELQALADARIDDVLKREPGRRLIQWGARAVDRAAVADLALAVDQRLNRRLARRTDSLLELLDPALVADFEAVLEKTAGLTPRAEAFITQLMQQDFVRGLFTDLIYAALLSFYRRVDPLFGGLGVRILESQIKSFIGYFMPMVQDRATAFAIAPANQRLAAAFARAVIQQLLGVPLRRWAELAAAGPRQSVEGFVRRAARDKGLGTLAEEMALTVWDELHASGGQRRVGDLLRLDAQAPWLAARWVDAIVPVLARPGVLAFIDDEAAARQRRGAEVVQATSSARRRASSRAPSKARRARPRGRAAPS
jgi:hypothetical protein